MMTEAEIEALIRCFEDGSLPKSAWTHTRHLIIALWYLKREGPDAARSMIRNGIRRYNELHGNTTGYHETITLAWIALVEQFVSARRPDVPVSSLATELIDTFANKDYLLQFYSRERLLSEEARGRWVPPDKQELG